MASSTPPKNSSQNQLRAELLIFILEKANKNKNFSSSGAGINQKNLVE